MKNDARGVGMNAVEFVKKFGIEEAKKTLSKVKIGEMSLFHKGLLFLVDSFELVKMVGGLEIAKKITFQKRLRNDKATHFIQHPENQKLIQLIRRNQKKPESSIEFERFEQAIRDVESVGGGV